MADDESSGLNAPGTNAQSVRVRCCVLFDVDGTLVDSSAFEDAIFVGAIRDVLGPVSIRDDWGRYRHVTDGGVLDEICQDNGVLLAGREPQIRRHFGELLATHLRASGPCPPIAGAVRLLETLRQRADAGVGIATGGWAHSARMKLRSAGFDIDAVPLASADDARERVQIMRHARAQLPASERTVYVGDREWDLCASEVLEWNFVGVGPALYGRCEHWMADYTGADALSVLLR